jgi:hypothetical protein
MGDLIDGMGTFGNGWVYRLQMLKNVGMAVGGPLIAAMAIKKMIDSAYHQHEETQSQHNVWEQERVRGAREGRLMGTWRGSAEGAVAAIDAKNAQIEDAEASKKELERRAKLSIWNPLRWSDAALGTDFKHKGVSMFGHLMWKSDEARELENKNEEIERSKEEKEKLEKDRAEHYARREALHADALAKTLKGDVRGARDTTYLANWWDDYNAANKSLGDNHEDEAKAIADMKMAMSQREEAMKWGRLLNARSGAGDIARVAALASGEIRGHRTDGDHAVVSALDNLIRQNADHHAEGMGHATTRDLMPRSLRERRS